MKAPSKKTPLSSGNEVISQPILQISAIHFQFPSDGGLLMQFMAQKPKDFTIKQARLRVHGEDFWREVGNACGRKIIATFRLAVHPIILCPELMDANDFKKGEEMVQSGIFFGNSRFKPKKRSIMKRFRMIMERGDPEFTLELEYGEKKISWKTLGLLFSTSMRLSHIVQSIETSKSILELTKLPTPPSISPRLSKLSTSHSKDETIRVSEEEISQNYRQISQAFPQIDPELLRDRKHTVTNKAKDARITIIRRSIPPLDQDSQDISTSSEIEPNDEWLVGELEKTVEMMQKLRDEAAMIDPSTIPGADDHVIDRKSFESRQEEVKKRKSFQFLMSISSRFPKHPEIIQDADSSSRHASHDRPISIQKEKLFQDLQRSSQEFPPFSMHPSNDSSSDPTLSSSVEDHSTNLQKDQKEMQNKEEDAEKKEENQKKVEDDQEMSNNKMEESLDRLHIKDDISTMTTSNMQNQMEEEKNVHEMTSERKDLISENEKKDENMLEYDASIQNNESIDEDDEKKAEHDETERTSIKSKEEEMSSEIDSKKKEEDKFKEKRSPYRFSFVPIFPRRTPSSSSVQVGNFSDISKVIQENSFDNFNDPHLADCLKELAKFLDGESNSFDHQKWDYILNVAKEHMDSLTRVRYPHISFEKLENMRKNLNFNTIKRNESLLFLMELVSMLLSLTQELPNVEGYLEKKGDIGVIKGWKRRYFALRGNKCIYFLSKDHIQTSTPRGYIPLSKNTVIDVMGPKCPNGFSLTTPETGRVWYLKADTLEERNSWMNAFTVHSRYGTDQ